MLPKQEQKMLKAAAKACGPEYQYDELEHCWYKETDDDYFGNPEWNPLTNSADTAEMCAKLEINTFFHTTRNKVECWIEDNGDEDVIKRAEKHDGTDASKEAAWRLAATMVAAKIGGCKDES